MGIRKGGAAIYDKNERKWGGLDLGLFRTSNRPSNRGGLDLGLFRKSNRPSGRGGLDLGLKKERIHYLGGGSTT